MAETVNAKLAVEISAKATKFGSELAKQSSAIQGFAKGVDNVTNQLKSAFGAISLALLGREIINVTSEFQKFEAVLTNTLGSSSEAQRILKNIQDFAAKTPFSVQELTGSFVKLANQGFKPAGDELKSLGDLAASTGKSFDQLTEAIIDAQTGEFERLKEFGIRASKQGDQVKFTFKGVETQTKFTASAIREYILSLGDAEGVSGAMAAISETLGGRISNLGDAWDNLLRTIGEGNKGILYEAVKSLTSIVNAAANLNAELELKAASYGLRSFNKLADETLDYLLAFGKTNSGKAVSDVIGSITDQSNKQFFENANANLKEFVKLLQDEGEEVSNIIVLWNRYLQTRIESGKQDKDAARAQRAANVEAAKAQALAALELARSKGLIEQLQERLKGLEEDKKKAFGINEIAAFNDKIRETKAQIDLLNAATKLTDFGQRQLANAQAGIETKAPTDFNRTVSGIQKNPDKTISALDTTLPTPKLDPADLQAFQDQFALIRKEYEETSRIAYGSSEQSALAFQLQIDAAKKAAQGAVEYGDLIGNALGSALSGQQSFADAMKRLTADLLKTFLARALGGIIASAATSGGPPPVAIALAAAGVAAISAMFSKIGGQSKSVGGALGRGGANSARQDFERQVSGEQIILVGGEIKFKGNSLVLALDKANKEKVRTG